MFHSYHCRVPDTIATANAASAKAQAGAAKRSVEQLTHEVERLLMISEAMWTFLQEQHGYTEEQLAERVMDIDLKDGVLDGRVKKQSRSECESCGRVLNKRHVRCIYCGVVAIRDPFER